MPLEETSEFTVNGSVACSPALAANKRTADRQGLSCGRWFLDSILIAVLAAVLIAPVVETILAQALPIFVVRKFGGSFRVQIIISTVIFAVCHFSESAAVGISAGVIGGFYFAFTYAHWREKSRWASFWVTATSHAIHNGIIVGLMALLGT